LTCLSTSTSNDKLAFDVGLKTDCEGESCWWTIHPASKQRSEGEKVRIGDDIILVSVATERYLHIYLIENTIHRVNASFQQTLWTLLPVTSGQVRMKNTGYVYGGEVLRMFHGNIDQCFTLPQSGVSEYPYSIFFETGAVCNHARSLWRLEFLRTK
jgi:ryanodine receptor 2